MRRIGLTRWLLSPSLLVIAALALLPCRLEARPTSSFDEVGRFYVQNFAPHDYHAHGQNWAIEQGSNGLLYVANNSGVLEYDGEELPVIFLTAKNQAEDLVVGLAAGANDYLPKPVSKSELLARVQTHIGLLLINRQLAGMVSERTSQLAERQRLLGERQRLISELEARNAELARFNYTVAHDLKNPLTTIMNFLGLVRRDAASGRTERLERDLDRLDAAARKLRLMLDQLFELSRVGVQANPPEEVAFGELVHDARLQLAGQVAERGVDVEVAPDLPAVIGDRAQLLEAVRHLLANALRYLGDQPAPRIEVGVRAAASPDAEPPTLYVRDNGIGIDQEYHDKVFGLFERLDPEASKGTGIGLALVKRIDTESLGAELPWRSGL